MNLNGGILPQIVHCLLSGSIDSIVGGVPGSCGWFMVSPLLPHKVLREDKSYKGLNCI